MKNDILGIIETAYQVERPRQEWLNEVGGAIYKQIGQGLGMFGLSYQITEEETLRFGESWQIEMPEGVDQGMRAGLETMPDWYIRSTFMRCDCDTSSQAGNERVREYSRAGMEMLAQTFGWHDIYIIGGMDPSRHGIYFGAWLAKKTKLSRQERATWTRVAIHLATAHRLQGRLAALGGVPTADSADAVLTTKGELTHASGEAKENEARGSLRDAVRGIETARGKMRKDDPDAAVDRWRALVSGRWSLVDHFESDGKRYVLARRNDVKLGGTEALSERERQAIGFAALGHNNKLIAYEMGISPSTVSVLLLRGARKLGSKTRDEMIAHFVRKD